MHPIILHGHFYQPPREEPWLEEVPREPSAAPDHDWNARITRECYRPLAAARVLDPAGRVRDLVNAFAWCSFDAGPTLLRWLDGHAPDVVRAMVAGDRASAARLGAGNAIAAPWHHVILPLASPRDRRTEVRWGIRDFRRRFGREPLGFWLPETAADGETLQILAEEGVAFTILAPHQVPALPPTGGAGRWEGANGASLVLFTYDGTLAHDVAFGDALADAEGWVARLRAHHGPVTALATDGETFGHHHRFGDLALAALVDRLREDRTHRLANFAMLLPRVGTLPTVTLAEPSSWSCPHGVERWRMACGCRDDPTTQQEWRTPLRVGLEVVAQGIHAVVQREWPREAGDPWTVRDHAGPDLDGVADLPAEARRLLEAERHALAMFTSCAWFFDDLGRIEPTLVLRHAARALDFLPAVEREALAEALLDALRRAHSNDPAKGNGEAIWHGSVLATADGPARLAAGLAALRELDPALLDELVVPTHGWEFDGDQIVTIHRRTGRRLAWHAMPVVLGAVAARVHVRPLEEGGASRVIPLERVPPLLLERLRERAVPLVLEATLPLPARERMHRGLLDPEGARREAFAAACAAAAREGLERGAPALHAVLDLWMLDERIPPPETVTAAFPLVAAAPPSRGRDALAERLGIAPGPAAP